MSPDHMRNLFSMVDLWLYLILMKTNRNASISEFTHNCLYVLIILILKLIFGKLKVFIIRGFIFIIHFDINNSILPTIDYRR